MLEWLRKYRQPLFTFLTVIGAGLVLFLRGVVAPRFVEGLLDYDVPLPWVTATILVGPWAWGFAAGVLLVALISWLAKTEALIWLALGASLALNAWVVLGFLVPLVGLGDLASAYSPTAPQGL